jgi:lipid-A-disaccharide synthase-like uncharacterized protein
MTQKIKQIIGIIGIMFFTLSFIIGILAIWEIVDREIALADFLKLLYTFLGIFLLSFFVL